MAPENVVLPLRSRVEGDRFNRGTQRVSVRRILAVRETAFLICDMWDRHWCAAANQRSDALARLMAPLIDRGRYAGIQVIHAPSDTIAFYRDTPARHAALAVPRLEPPRIRNRRNDPPLPVDHSGRACETPDSWEHRTWTRQHPAIRIMQGDVISESGPEIYSFLRHRAIRTLIFMGVHSNVCILNRPFGIKQMTGWGIACVLVRDLTDAMYDPRRPPFVTHEEGARLVIEYIETHWCPTVLSHELADALSESR